MRQSDVVKQTGASRDELRYFERKGFIRSERKCVKTRWVRDYSEEDIPLIRLIVKYRRERFERDAAYEKAKEELRRPRLI